MAAEVKIEGLKAFTKNLKEMDRDLAKAVRLSFNAAADIVTDEARAKIPKRSGKARASVKSASTQTKARIRGGGKRAPYYPWLDFGGRVGQSRGIKRSYLKDGRYIYKAFFANRDEFTQIMQRELVKVAQSAGVAVDNGQ
ncbi:HK97 gp10 family phage protein [Actinospongicola halichondriae]|uniref:HK97 gp10 family phage protein n=1 Tax=Actinospongicola halichondriae TaxID=3236844 RepID=UPI003D5C3479